MKAVSLGLILVLTVFAFGQADIGNTLSAQGNATLSAQSSQATVSIVVTATPSSITAGASTVLQATLQASDLSFVQNVTALATWSSSDVTKLTISNTPASGPIGLGVAVGTASAIATFGSFTGNTTVNIIPVPDFSVSVSPMSIGISQGGNNTTTVTVTSLNSFNSATTLSCQNLPAYLSCGFSANPITPPANSTATSTLTVTATAGATIGTGSFTIQGTSGSLLHTTSLGFSINAAGKNTLTLTLTGQGTVTDNQSQISCPPTCTGSYTTGTNVTLTEAPTSGQTFQAWGGSCSGSSSTCVLTMNSNLSASAAFTSGENAECAIGDVLSFATSDGPAALPTSCIYTGLDGTPSPGSNSNLACGANLQTALNALTAGQSLTLPAVCNGVKNVIVQNITFPAISGADINHWVTIKTDQTGASSFPPEHNRTTPCANNQASVSNYPTYPCSTPANLMPRIQSTAFNNQTAVSFAQGANYYRFIGIEFGPDPNHYTQSDIINTAGADHIIFDRSILHGNPLTCTLTGNNYSCTANDTAHGIEVNAATNIAVINSEIYDILCPTSKCVDALAIFGGTSNVAGSHTFKFYNNLLASAGETWIFGGGLAPNEFLPTDGWFLNNHSFKPVSWFLCTACSGDHPIPKNHGEFKRFQRALVQGNVFENNIGGWQTDQSGQGLNINALNSNHPVSGTGSSDGAGNLTATVGTFDQVGVWTTDSVNCPQGPLTAGCRIKFNGVVYFVTVRTDATHVAVTPTPPSNASAAFTSYGPGTSPTTVVKDITVRYNDFRNLHRGINIAEAVGAGGVCALGTANISVHDDLLQGINELNWNGTAGDLLAMCVQIVNSCPNPINVRNFRVNHMTCPLFSNGPGGYAGLDVSQDSTDTQNNGNCAPNCPGAYFQNEQWLNSIGPAGAQVLCCSGSKFVGGLTAGLAQQGCSPPQSANCTWTYAKMVLGLGQWNGQENGKPTPEDNQICFSVAGDCFPSGSAYTSLYTTFNGPAGQPGYLGNYVLTSGNRGTGTDGLDIGVSNWNAFNAFTANVWHQTTYTAASITASSPLPAGTHGTAYSFNFGVGSGNSASASDMQIWLVTSGTIPAGLTLSRGGLLSGTPTTAGTSTFTLQLYDGAQQYATKSFSLTIN